MDNIGSECFENIHRLGRNAYTTMFNYNAWLQKIYISKYICVLNDKGPKKFISLINSRHKTRHKDLNINDVSVKRDKFVKHEKQL